MLVFEDSDDEDYIICGWQHKHQEQTINDVTAPDVVFLAWVGGVLMSDWLQKGSLEIVSPSVLRGGGLQVCGG